MAKAAELFTGNSSHGVPEEYARREDGVWFSRYYAFNGYGMAMNKWRRVSDDLSLLIKGDVMDYGFLPLRRRCPKGLRLPNPVLVEEMA